MGWSTLPEKMTFYCRKQDKDGIYPTFPVDSEAKHDTAISWAQDRVYVWEKQEYESLKEPIVFEFNNTGFDNVTIKSLDKRGNGGRAYQVIVEQDGNKFRVDLRENALMDVILTSGIQAGGRLNGSFCFIKDGAQTNLVRVNSEDYLAAQKESEKRRGNEKTLKKSDLIPGYRYETQTGDSYIFLGHVYSRSMNKEDGTLGKIYKGLLFFHSSGIPDSHLKLFQTGETTNGTYMGYYLLNKSHSLKIPCEKVLDEADLPKFISNIQAAMLNNWHNNMKSKFVGQYWLDETYKLYEIANMKFNKKDLGFDEQVTKTMWDTYTNRRQGYYRY